MSKTISFFIGKQELLKSKDIVNKKLDELLLPLYSKYTIQFLDKEIDPYRFGYNFYFQIYRIIKDNQYLLFE